MNTRLLATAACALVTLVWADEPPLPMGLDHWEWRHPVPTGIPLRGVVYGTNRFVAVGEYGTIITSADGEHWEAVSVGNDVTLSAVAYGNGRFVAVGWRSAGWFFPTDSTAVILSSSNGVGWMEQEVPLPTHPCLCSPSPALYDITFGNGKFVAVGITYFESELLPSRILTSSDGLEWRLTDAGTEYSWAGVAFGNGRFVAVGGHSVRTSEDGESWVSQTNGVGASIQFTCIAHGNGLFVAFASYPYDPSAPSRVLTSPNGVNWTQWTNVFSSYVYAHAITFGNGVFVAFTYGDIWVSTNGTNWVEVGPTGLPIVGANYGDGRFVAVGDSGIVATSFDGQTWTQSADGSSDSFSSVAYGNGKFVAVNGRIWSSPDGYEWTAQKVTTNANGVGFGNGIFIAVGPNGTILTAKDGTQWATRTSGTTNHLTAVTGGDGTFVAVGVSTILTSTNGVIWSDRSASVGQSTLTSIAWGDGLFVAVGADYTQFPYTVTLTSPDGFNWTSRSNATSRGLEAITFGAGIFVAVTGWCPEFCDAGMVTSTDGITWVPQGPRGSGITYGNGTFVAVGGIFNFRFGHRSWVFSSQDGTNWVQGKISAAQALNAVGYGNGSFVAVGGNGAILQSDVLPRLRLNQEASHELKLFGPIGRYRIESVTDLHQTNDWQPLATIPLTASPTRWTNTQATQATQQFYRAVKVP